MTGSENIKNKEIGLKDFIKSIRRWIRFILSYWKILFLLGLIGCILGFSIAYIRKPYYTATTTFVIEEGGSAIGGALGQYAGLASMAGIDLSGGGNNLFQGDNILELYKSKNMLKKTLLSSCVIHRDTGLLINRYIEFNNLKERWNKEKELVGVDFNINPKDYTVKHDSLVNRIVKSILESSLKVSKQDKKLSIINVSYVSKDELFSKEFVEALVGNVNEFYRVTKTKKSAENVAVLQKQTDSVRRALNSAISGVAISADANPNPNPARQVLRVPGQRRTVDVQASSAVLEELIKHLEISKLTMRNDEPLIQIIDRPVLPLDNDRIGMLKGSILGGLVVCFLMVIFLTFKYLIDD